MTARRDASWRFSLLGARVLAVVDLLEELHPAVHREGHVVEVGTVDEGRRGGVDALARCVLPETVATITPARLVTATNTALTRASTTALATTTTAKTTAATDLASPSCSISSVDHLFSK